MIGKLSVVSFSRKAMNLNKRKIHYIYVDFFLPIFASVPAIIRLKFGMCLMIIKIINKVNMIPGTISPRLLSLSGLIHAMMNIAIEVRTEDTEIIFQRAKEPKKTTANIRIVIGV